MPQQPIFPFRRVSVDHMVRGVTRVWWDLDRMFREPGPYAFQLQYGYTGANNAVDWRNVGPPIINGYFALTTEAMERLVTEQITLNDTEVGIGIETADVPEEIQTAHDPNWREGGYDLLTHYRVTLTTPVGTYVSQPANCHGELTERDWLLAREIIRKEELRHRLVSVPGYLIKRYRYGKPCPRCRDELTQEVTDHNCPICNGTGFEVGYHPPVPLMCWDLSPELIQENVDAQLKGTTRENAYVSARVIGFPTLNKKDIWVNGTNDERWVVDTVQVVAAMRGVPLVYNIKLGLLPFNNTVYTIEVGGEPADRDPRPVLPVEGCGNIIVDHNYGGADALTYVDASGKGIAGAYVYIFRQADMTAAAPAFPNRLLAAAATTTVANGRWALPLRLKPGNYSILYEKLGAYGPDVLPLTAAVPENIAPFSMAPALRRTKKEPTVINAKPPTSTDDFWAV